VKRPGSVQNYRKQSHTKRPRYRILWVTHLNEAGFGASGNLAGKLY
jgi:hypothetical protein